MAADFIPLFPPPRSAASTITAGSFAPVSTPASPPSPSGTAFLTKAAAASATPVHLHRQVNIEIKREGDRISQIRIQCRCGELIELDCEY